MSIKSTNITMSGIIALLESNRNGLKYVNVRGCMKISKDDVKMLRKECEIVKFDE